jgi:hypothetical protein
MPVEMPIPLLLKFKASGPKPTRFLKKRPIEV